MYVYVSRKWVKSVTSVTTLVREVSRGDQRRVSHKVKTKSRPLGVALEFCHVMSYICRASSQAARAPGSNLLFFPIRIACIDPFRTQAQSVGRVTPMIAMTSVLVRYDVLCFSWLMIVSCEVLSRVILVNTDECRRTRDIP